MAQLEAGTTAQQIAVAQADVQVAQAELDLLIAPAPPEELVAAEMALETAQVAVSLAQAEYDQVAWGGTSAPHLGLVLQRAGADYQVAVANYEALLRGPTEEEIGVAQAQLGRSQAQLNVLRAGPAPEEIGALQARVDQAEVLVSQAESDLEKAILAPFAGTVGLVRKRAGELVAPGESVVVIGDPSRLRIETTDLSEIHIPTVGLGQEAEVTFDALPGRTLVGRVLSEPW